MNRFRLTGTVCLLILLLQACGGTGAEPAVQHPPGQHFVGRVSDSDAFIGLVRDGQTVPAYICDGTAEKINVYGWFRGSLSGDSFDLASDDGLRLTGQFTADTAVGTVSLVDGTPHAFSADLAAPPAGLYRHEETVDGQEIISGWIVLANEEYRGGKRHAIVGGPPAIVGGPPAK